MARTPKKIVGKTRKARKNSGEADVHSGTFNGWERWREMGVTNYARTWAGHYVNVVEEPDPKHTDQHNYLVFVDDKRLGKQGFRKATDALAAVRTEIGPLKRNPANKATLDPKTLKRAATMITSGKLDKATVAEIATAVKAPKNASLKEIAKRVNAVGTKVAVATASSVGVPEPVTRAALKISTAIQTAPFRAAKWAFGKVKSKMGKKNPFSEVPDAEKLRAILATMKITPKRDFMNVPLGYGQWRAVFSYTDVRNDVLRDSGYAFDVSIFDNNQMTVRVGVAARSKGASPFLRSQTHHIAEADIDKLVQALVKHIPAMEKKKMAKKNPKRGTPSPKKFVPWKGVPKKSASGRGVKNPVWTRAYINKLPDSAFLYVEKGGHKDEQGKTVPRGLRHFPVRDLQGRVSEAHARNAISRIPQATAKGLTPKLMKELQQKARALLFFGTGSDAVRSLKQPLPKARPHATLAANKGGKKNKAAKNPTVTSQLRQLGAFTYNDYYYKVAERPRSGEPLWQKVGEGTMWHSVKKTLAGKKHPLAFRLELVKMLPKFSLKYKNPATAKKRSAKRNASGAWVVYWESGTPTNKKFNKVHFKTKAAAYKHAAQKSEELHNAHITVLKHGFEVADFCRGEQVKANTAKKRSAKRNTAKIAPHMWVISKDSTGRYIVTIGDPRLSSSTLKRRFATKADLKDWIKYDMPQIVSPTHVHDATKLGLLKGVQKNPAKRPAPTKAQLAVLAREFRKARKVAAKYDGRVMTAKCMLDSTIHDSERHFAMTKVTGNKVEVRLAPELAYEPLTVVRGILHHELGHALAGLMGAKAPVKPPKSKAYDAIEKHADKIAEKVFKAKIYYDARGVETTSSTGRRPRPAGLR